MPPEKTPLSGSPKPTVPQSPMQEAFTWIWKTFGEPAIKGGLTWSWKAAQWKLAADRYAERLAQDYGKLFVLGQPEPKDIDDIYTYVNVLEKVSAFKRYDPEQLHELFMGRGLWHDTKERRDGVKMVRTGKNLFILGQPGAGKTTFLKQVTIRAAQGKLRRKIDNQLRSWLPEAVQAKLQETKDVTQIPVFISLKAHADAERTLFESIEHELQVCRFPDAKPFVELLLKSGRALVLWDGLDEVSQDAGRRDKLSGEMREFMRQYRESQFVITCRVAATEYSFDNVDYLEMADFDEKQMNTFIHRWFYDRQLADQCRKELQKDENKGLRELARNPLLLTLLAIAYEETLTFPQRRVEIYEEAIDALLKKWDSKRNIRRGEEQYKALSLGRKRQMLARIGAETFNKGEFILPQRRLADLIEAYMSKLPGAEDDIDGVAVLHSIAARHGIFVERAYKLYSFAHLSFQEYFAAKFIVDNSRQGSLERLLDHLVEDQWRQLFLLTASLLNEADAEDFFSLFIDRLNRMAILEPVQHYLTWAQEKGKQAAQAMKQNYSPVSLRAWYLALARDFDRALARDLDRERALALARYFDLAHARSLKRILALDLEWIFDLALALERTLDLARERSYTYARALSQSTKLCEELGLTELAEQLKNLEWPYDVSSRVSSRAAWELFAQNLQAIIDDFRDLSGIAYLQIWDEPDEQFIQSVQWDKTQLKTYTGYLKGTALLIDCLKLAAVSDRAGIEERLLLPASTNT